MTSSFSRLGLLLAALAASGAASAQILPAYGEDRAGTAGFQFLELAVDPRGAALGGTAVATTRNAAALFWNPALSSRGGATQVMGAHLAYAADVSLNFAAVTQQVGAYTVGAHVQTLDSGEMDVTTEFSGPAGTGQTFRYLGVAAGLSVSQALTDLFSYGVTAKVAREASADVAMTVPLLDLGVHYRVGDTGAQIGVAIRNFGLSTGRPRARSSARRSRARPWSRTSSRTSSRRRRSSSDWATTSSGWTSTR